jgi:hypothetical protein
MTTARDDLSLDLEEDLDYTSSVFDFLGTTVRAVATNIEQLQLWCAVYSEFRIPARPADITVNVHEPRHMDRPRAATIEVGGRTRMWNGREPLFPPLREPGLNRYLYVQAFATGRHGHAVLVLGADASLRTALSMACTVRGAGFFGCDIVPVDLDDLLAMPWPKALALDAEALDVLQIGGSHPWLMPFRTRGGELLYRATPSSVLGRRTCRVATDIAAILIMNDETRKAAPQLSAMREADAFEWLLRHLAVRPRQAELVTDSLVRLCQRVPVYALTLGTLDDTAALIDQMLV